MPEIELTAGTIEYEDTGGEGPVLLLLGGLIMDGSVWDPLVAELGEGHRCVAPTLPLGAHRKPMRPDADLSLQGFAGMIAELLERLDLREVTLVTNDHAAALVFAGGDSPALARVARLVISSCESFENYPPGLPGKNVRALAWLPGGVYAAAQSMRMRVLRRSPIGFGWMAKHPLPEALIDGWFLPLQEQRAVRRDVRKYMISGRRKQMIEACERLRSFARPTLVVWTPEDKVQRPEHGRRFAELIPDARLVEIADSYTLIMRDQPQAFARAIREFVAEAAAPRVAA
ncbi:MAG TPA: alpha/beta hydrolase [Solirubrobacteraceae bacterium]|nr:alpha/beta hydrolase [Solirubrobacteraceae bacterium]